MDTTATCRRHRYLAQLPDVESEQCELRHYSRHWEPRRRHHHQAPGGMGSQRQRRDARARDRETEETGNVTMKEWTSVEEGSKRHILEVSLLNFRLSKH